MDEFLEEENELIYSFVGLKNKQLKQKLTRISGYLDQKGTVRDFQDIAAPVRILFDNLYIEAEYLRMLIAKNIDIFEANAEHAYSGDEA